MLVVARRAPAPEPARARSARRRSSPRRPRRPEGSAGCFRSPLRSSRSARSSSASPGRRAKLSRAGQPGDRHPRPRLLALDGGDGREAVATRSGARGGEDIPRRGAKELLGRHRLVLDARLARPVADDRPRRGPRGALDLITLGSGTAIGDAIDRSVAAARPSPTRAADAGEEQDPRHDRLPLRRRADDRRPAAARGGGAGAKQLGIPINTVALGTRDAVVDVPRANGVVEKVTVVPDTKTLQRDRAHHRRSLRGGPDRRAPEAGLQGSRQPGRPEEGGARGDRGVRRRRASCSCSSPRGSRSRGRGGRCEARRRSVRRGRRWSLLRADGGLGARSRRVQGPAGLPSGRGAVGGRLVRRRRLGARLPAPRATSSAARTRGWRPATWTSRSAARPGSPVGPGVTTQRSLVFHAHAYRQRAPGRRASSRSSAASRASGGGGRALTGFAATGIGLKPAQPLFSVVVTSPVVRRSQVVRAACPAPARLVGATHAVGFDQTAPPTPGAARRCPRHARSVVEGVVVARVQADGRRGRRAPSVQVRALCVEGAMIAGDLTFGTPLAPRVLSLVPGARARRLPVARAAAAAAAVAYPEPRGARLGRRAGRAGGATSSPGSCSAAARSSASPSRGRASRLTTTSDRATVVLVVDVSVSMNAKDVAPTRLEAARAAISTFVDRVPGRVKVGLIAFADDPVVDHGADHRPEADRARDRLADARLRDRDRRRGRARGRASSGSSAGETGRTTASAAGKEPLGAVVLLSDGAQTRGVLAPEDGARLAQAGAHPRLHDRARNADRNRHDRPRRRARHRPGAARPRHAREHRRGHRRHDVRRHRREPSSARCTTGSAASSRRRRSRARSRRPSSASPPRSSRARSGSRRSGRRGFRSARGSSTPRT